MTEAGEPFAFVAVCHLCGARSQRIPAEGGGDTWWSATCWSVIALKAHEAECVPTLF